MTSSAGKPIGLPRGQPARDGPLGVLLLVQSLGLSGRTKAVVELVRHMDRARFRPVVCALQEDPAEVGLDGMAEAEVICIHKRPGLRPFTVRTLAKVVRKQQVDVIHAFNPGPAAYGGLAGVITRRRVLCSLSAFACLSPAGEHRYVPQPFYSGPLADRLRNRIAGWMVSYYVAVSDSLGRSFIAVNGLSENKLRVVPYGVECAHTDARTDPTAGAGLRLKQELGIPAEAPVVGSVARLVEQKDFPTLLRAFGALGADGAGVHLVLVGDGPKRRSLEELTSQLGLGARVHFAGMRGDVPAALAMMDVFALSSKFEPFGVSLLEAMAAGKAIVSTRVNETAEILEDGRCGLLVPPEDAASMADALRGLLSDRARRQSLAGAARARAERCYSVSAMTRAYEALYCELAGLPQDGAGARGGV